MASSYRSHVRNARNTAMFLGGIFAASDVTLTTGTIVSANTAAGDGGGIYADAEVTIDASFVRDNNAHGNGGGLFNTDGGSVTLDAESAIVENTPTNCIGTPACAA